MKEVQTKTTKNAVENSKFDEQLNIVLEDRKKDKLDGVSIVSGLCVSCESTDFDCNESAPTIPKPNASVPEPTQTVSSVGENSKKGVDKTKAVKDTRLSAEGM